MWVHVKCLVHFCKPRKHSHVSTYIRCVSEPRWCCVTSLSRTPPGIFRRPQDLVDLQPCLWWQKPKQDLFHNPRRVSVSPKQNQIRGTALSQHENETWAWRNVERLMSSVQLSDSHCSVTVTGDMWQEALHCSVTGQAWVLGRIQSRSSRIYTQDTLSDSDLEQPINIASAEALEDESEAWRMHPDFTESLLASSWRKEFSTNSLWLHFSLSARRGRLFCHFSRAALITAPCSLRVLFVFHLKAKKTTPRANKSLVVLNVLVLILSLAWFIIMMVHPTGLPPEWRRPLAHAVMSH